MTETVLDRTCPDCGGRLVCLHSARMTHVHCEERCGYGMTTRARELRVEEFPTPEDAYDAMRAVLPAGRGAR